jgi:predicted DNA-binding transcriptional regulator AlpA
VGNEERQMAIDNENPMGLLWEVKNIAAFIGLSERSTYHLLSQGLLPAKKIGDKWVAQKDELRRFFTEKAGE